MESDVPEDYIISMAKTVLAKLEAAPMEESWPNASP